MLETVYAICMSVMLYGVPKEASIYTLLERQSSLSCATAVTEAAQHNRLNILRDTLEELQKQQQ